MYQGGAIINKQTESIIRYTGVFVPILLTIYGFMIQAGLASAHSYHSDIVFYVIMTIWLCLSLYQFLYIPTGLRGAIMRIVTYHTLAGAYIIYVSGFATPLMTAWIILFLIAYWYFGHRGVQLSALALIIITALSATLTSSSDLVLFHNAVVTLSLLAVGAAVVLISRAQEDDSLILKQSRQQEALERNRILTIVNNLADAVLSTDNDGIIRVYNAASLSLLDTNKSLNGLHINDVLSLKNQDGKTVSLYKLLKKAHGVTIRDDLITTIEEETIRLEATCSPIRSSYTNSSDTQPQDGYIIILRDITKAKSLEEERDEFISVVSHELRTPITIAEGTLSNVQLMMGRADIAPKILEDAVTTAHDQIIYLARMVNDLSTLSRAERGVADDAEVIDIKSLASDLFAEYEPEAAKRDLHFNLDIASKPGTVAASRLYLKELLQNFITNSIKYTKQGSVTLTISRHDDTITFEVADTGIGISKSDQVKIFEKFYRSEDYRTRETGGTGLGLYVAMKLAKKLGTSIALTSRLNHGSRFSFSLKSSHDTAK